VHEYLFTESEMRFRYIASHYWGTGKEVKFDFTPKEIFEVQAENEWTEKKKVEKGCLIY
jgi:hypothetical protein